MPRLFSASSAQELSGKSATSARGLRDVLRVLAELAQRGLRWKNRASALRDARSRYGAHAVARRGVALQMEVALGDAQIDELPSSPLGHALQILERRARLGIAARSEQHLRAAEIVLVAGPD